MRRLWSKWVCGWLAFLLAMGLAGCGAGETTQEGDTFVLGDTTFSAEHEEPDINPHNAYSGWACIRYGVGETLFRYSDTMELEPWLATDYTLVDDCTWEITLRDGVTFSSGRPLDGEAVAQCLEHLLANHDRARRDLMIDSITAEGQTVTIHTSQPRPTLLYALSDPYGCIIDLDAGITPEGMVTGTGPYRAVSLQSGEQLQLEAWEGYWGGEPGYDRITVLTIPDGDTLTLALQSGELDGAYGIPYASHPLFEQGGYTISSCATSRTFFFQMNFASPVLQDPAVRQAIAMGIDKERFVDQQLAGKGTAAVGPFPSLFSFGGDQLTDQPYDPEGAKALLEQAGWVDTDGDGIREKEGQLLTLRCLTYPSRPELPLLAEAAQATLGEIGIQVTIQSTADHNTIRQDPTAWDLYACAVVTAPGGDPAYFFTTHCLEGAAANNGGYQSEPLEALAQTLEETFDQEERSRIGVEMQNILLEDHAFVFCAHLEMSLISSDSVSGFTAHPCDFYEITQALAPAE